MELEAIRGLEADEVAVVYSCYRGIPSVNHVSRSIADAVNVYNEMVVEHGEWLSAQLADRWRLENPGCGDQIEMIDGGNYLAHTSDFDVYLELIRIRPTVEVHRMRSGRAI
jgi:hypothetical protein